MTKQGYGVIKCDNEKFDEIIIESKNLQNAESGDRIRAAVISVNDEIALGNILEILEPAGKIIKGKLLKKGRNYFIEPAKKISKKIAIKKASLFNALPGDVVEAKIVRTKTDSLQAKVTNIISRNFSGDVSYFDLYKEYGLTDSFPSEVESEIDSFSESSIEDEIKSRFDLRDEIIFTIDPDDAKDYDDAVSLKELSNGNLELGVHIADVGFFTKEGSQLDKEAFKRATSIYMPGKAIPMLPNKLTTELCSLVEGKARLTFSIIIELSTEADILSYKLKKSVINSKKRFTYSEAQEELDKYIENINSAPSESTANNQTTGYILYGMYKLSKKLFEKRKAGGSIDFNTIEPAFIMDNNGKVTDISVKKLMDTNHMIEEFMLLANRLVTERFANKYPEIPFIYRVHDSPPSEKVEELKKVLKYFGYPIKKNKKITPKVFQSLLESIKNDRFKNILNDLIIRSMAKAVYSVENIGHFGLGFKFYTHFTSPIRRYPDLVVHRMLEKFILNDENKFPQFNYMSNIAVHSSETERRAMEIEREAIKIKQIQFLSGLGDKIFKAVIYNIVEFGFFIEIPEYFVGGLVHIKNLSDDYYYFEPEKYRLIGKHSKKIFKLGDEIPVTIYNLDSETRRIDFVPVNYMER